MRGVVQVLVIAGVLSLAGIPPAGAAEGPLRLALVVGSNLGGPGQAELRFAESDAQRLADLLVEVGDADPLDVDLLLHPTKQKLLVHLAALRARLDEQRRLGNQTVFTFYFSGHARAAALNLGEEELSLDELREALLQFPATVTVAVLDACQTGAISSIKGAAPAAAFSINSVQQLDATGIAIMASSSASELSQESEALRSAYFTHHLLVGLRGAADLNQDGKVSLSEVYGYAYHRTLAATARTAIGKQHVTLENNLKGKGEMILTYPARSDTRLNLPAAFSGEILLERAPGGVVMAEVIKAPGEAISLALPRGEYAAVVRIDGKVYRCEIGLGPARPAELTLSSCQQEVPEAGESKGPVEDVPSAPRWTLEAGGGVLVGARDSYRQALETFGFGAAPTVSPSLALAVNVSLWRNLSAGLRIDLLDRGSFRRTVSGSQPPATLQSFGWSAYGLAAVARWEMPLGATPVQVYLQVGAGLTLGTSTFKVAQQPSEQVEQRFWGYELLADCGLAWMPWEMFGFTGQAGYLFAPTLKDEQGHIHNSGGFQLRLGIRWVF